MATNFRVNGSDFGDLFIRKDLFSSGGLWIWGRNNNYGALGNGNTTSQSSPVQTVSGGINWKSVAGGEFHTGAIKTDGTLWGWGRNDVGQLGTNSLGFVSSPVQTVAAGTDWKQVSCGSYHTAAVKTDGTLWLWGYNIDGQLGNNSEGNKSSPVQTISAGTNWKQVSCGSSYTAAVKTDGTLWGWGRNDVGQLGTNSTVYLSSPIQTISGGTDWKQVSCGFYHTAAVKTDGTLWLWGFNGWGQLGNDNHTQRSSPVQTFAGGTNWKSVACGDFHTAAVKTDGTLWCWGFNNNGQLGDNNTTAKSSPVQTVAAGTNWKQVSCGSYHTAAVKTDGTLWLWGYNIDGQLGANDVINQSSPVQTIAAGTNWTNVDCGTEHTIAIRENYY